MHAANVLLFGAALFFSFLTLAQAAAIPQAVNQMASGYKNVAYFVNWVRPLTIAPPKARLTVC